MKEIGSSIRILLMMTLLTGLLYPGVVYLGGRAFAHEAEGSLVIRDGAVAGSGLLAQRFVKGIYFHPRPSAADYGTVASGASNLGPTSANLKKAVDERRAALTADTGTNPPEELLSASGSGLDPHISPEAAKYQIPRIVRERGLGEEGASRILNLIDRMTEPPFLGIFGRARVNVLLLNIELDREFPHG
jgi:K+-transporting ATPase ATPase C chain